eukprot:scaffold607224_cov42-Prasinocladus_malaysianus.AAC.1
MLAGKVIPVGITIRGGGIDRCPNINTCRVTPRASTERQNIYVGGGVAADLVHASGCPMHTLLAAKP